MQQTQLFYVKLLGCNMMHTFIAFHDFMEIVPQNQEFYP